MEVKVESERAGTNGMHNIAGISLESGHFSIICSFV
jgi:hypothetical protein